MRLRRSNNDRGIDDRKKRMPIRAATALGNAGRIQSFRIVLSHEKFDRHRLQNPEMIRTPTPEADEKNSFRLLHLLSLISKVRHLARSISWQTIDTFCALASTARISQMRERCRPRKSFAVEASAQSAPTYRLKAVIAPRATPRDAVDFLVICQRRMLSQRSRREQGTAGLALACGAKRGRRWTALRASDKPNVLWHPPAQSTRLTCSVIDEVI